MITNFFTAVFTSWVVLFGSIYQQSINLIEGGSQSLSVYQGKKLLIVTLPIIQNASSDSLLYSLDTLANAHATELKVIATPAFEDGFTIEQKTSLKNWYRSKLGNHVLITEGYYVRKTSGVLQHPLYKWLTHIDQNGRFDIDITDAETKFFINTDGKIYGVLRPGTKIWGYTLNQVINRPITEE